MKRMGSYGGDLSDRLVLPAPFWGTGIMLSVFRANSG